MPKVFYAYILGTLVLEDDTTKIKISQLLPSTVLPFSANFDLQLKDIDNNIIVMKKCLLNFNISI